MKKTMTCLLAMLLGLLLWGCGSEEVGATTQPEESGTVLYVVHVTDEKGTPIPNALVQLCSNVCVVAGTDETGTAEFTMEPSEYKASVTVLPQGYAHTGEETEFAFPEGSRELTIVLKAQ